MAPLRNADADALLHSLISSLEEGFLVYDRDLRYRAWNQFMEEITGLAAGDVIGRRNVEVFPELRDHPMQALLRRALDGEAVTSPDTPFRVEETGREGWLVARYLPWRDSDGTVAGVVGLIRDITDRKAGEQALVRSERELTLHNRIAGAFLTTPDDEMFAKVVGVLLEELDSSHGMFGYLDSDGSLVVPSMSYGIFDQCRVADKTVVFPRATWGGVWGRALAEGRSVLLNSPGNVPDGHIPIERALCAPIIDRGQLIGLLAVANRDREYTEADRQQLEHIARHVAPILHARLDRDRHEQERARVEEDLRWALAEKDLLLREVHHRVKNNMAVISSMLRLQAASVPDEGVRTTFDTVQMRIKTMALVHELLYSTGEFATINLREYLEKVMRTLSHTRPRGGGRIELRTECADLTIDIDSAIPCGLIVTELVGNALRYAFPDGRDGVVSMTMARDGNGLYELTVRDDGVGFERGEVGTRGDGFGLEMVGLLARQLDGELEMRSGHGAEIRVRFPPQEGSTGRPPVQTAGVGGDGDA